ncbi:hypothetical protein HY643_01385 [Candidatus Woesearchaeota archaeon]|nr:hypothetical protein [Candidatus Woesearchaeota archaeon]
MGLEHVFGTAEKPEKEKKLQVIVSDEAVVDELLACFEKNKYNDEHNLDEGKEYFKNVSTFLKSFQISHERIKKFYKKAAVKKNESESFGLYLSALIQTSYQQGNNNFKFGAVNANWLGVFLEGKITRPINIKIDALNGYSNFSNSNYFSAKIKKIEGKYNFWQANNFSTSIQNLNGNDAFCHAQNFSAKITNLKGNLNFKYAEGFSAKIKKIEGEYNFFLSSDFSVNVICLKGSNNFTVANNGLVKIANNQGKEFGRFIENCTIYAPNQEVLDSIKQQIEWGSNIFFHLKKG